MKNDLIIDFETMSPDANNCAVIDVAAMVFDWERFTSGEPYTLKDIRNVTRFKLSVAEQVKNYNYVVTSDTLQFWSELPSEVRAKITPKKSDLSVEEFTKQFMDYLIEGPNIKNWWSRSNTFDPIILVRLFKSQDMLSALESKLKYWAVRDTRTWIDAKFNFPKENGFVPIDNEEVWEANFKKHDSSWDILADVLRFQAIARAEADLPQIEG
jgi:hypothetical protein